MDPGSAIPSFPYSFINISMASGEVFQMPFILQVGFNWFLLNLSQVAKPQASWLVVNLMDQDYI